MPCHWRTSLISSDSRSRILLTGCGSHALAIADLLDLNVNRDLIIRRTDPAFCGGERTARDFCDTRQRLSLDPPQRPRDPLADGKRRQRPIEERELCALLGARAFVDEGLEC